MLASLQTGRASDKVGRTALERIEALKGTRAASKPEPGETWSDAILAALDSMEDLEKAAWLSLFAQAQAANATQQPSASWLARTAAIISSPGLGRGRFLERLGAWLPLVGPGKAHVFSDENIRVLTALAWALAGDGESQAAQLAGDLAVACLEKIPNWGAVCAKAGNASIWTLGNMPGLHGIGQLARLKVNVGYVVAERLVQSALELAAEREGMDIEEAQEVSVPTFGLDAAGRRAEHIGEWTVTCVLDGRGVTTRWQHPAEGELAVAPKAVRNTAAWKRVHKDIDAIRERLNVEAARLERHYLSGRSLTLAELSERVLAHPITGQVARRVLWTVTDSGTSRHALPRDGRLEGLGGPIPMSPTARATPFHPLGNAIEEVAVWSDFLRQHGVQSPWQQLQREVYLPDPDEMNACQRFVQRAVDQRALVAWARTHQWRFTMQGTFDGGARVAWRDIPGRQLRAEIDVDGSDDEPQEGLFRTVVLGALRFRRAGQPMALAEVPAIVYSEIVRALERMSATSSSAR